MPAIEEELRGAGLEVLGLCQGMADHGAKLLQEAALLEDFSQAEADTLGGVMLRVRAQAGQVLIHQGTIGDWMMLLLSGTVDVIKRSVQGETSRLAVIKRGASVGEMSMLDCEPRNATCVALEEVEAGVLTRSAIEQLIREHPAVGAKLLVKLTQILAQRLRNASNQLVKERGKGRSPED